MPSILSQNGSGSLALNNMSGSDEYMSGSDEYMSGSDEYMSESNYYNITTQIPDTDSSRSEGGIIVLIVIASVICCFCSPFICDRCSKICETLECHCIHDTFKLIGNICFDMLGCIFCNWPNTRDYCNENETGYCNEFRCCCRSYCSRDCFSRIYLRLCPYSCRCEKKKSQTTHIENTNFEIIVTQPVDRNYFCVICHEEFGKGKHGKLSCGHKFHKECIDEWLSVSVHKDCPVCRHPT